MSTIHAIFENGVFRPLEPVHLQEACEVEFEPRLVAQNPHELQTAPLKGVYAVLSQRFASGETDVAERHDEHQP